MDRMAPSDRALLPRALAATSFLDRLPKVERYFTRCLPLMPLAVQQLDLSAHDLVISSSHCVAKGVIVAPDALHLCYCHSPMRHVWDMQCASLRSEGLDGGARGALARWLLHGLRPATTASTTSPPIRPLFKVVSSRLGAVMRW